MKLKKGKWERIIIHHTAGSVNDTVKSITAVHKKRGFETIGYHYVLELDDELKGHLKIGRPDKFVGAHCNDDGANSNSIGIVIPGNYSEIKLNENTKESLINALCHLCKKYKITQIEGHKEVKGAATQCPGNNINLNNIRELVFKKLK